MPDQCHAEVDTHAPGPHGEVPVRVYLPEKPWGIGLVWLHGGAFRMGDLDVPEAHRVAGALADDGITVVSVDYRLAVDGVHFPVPSDDALAAWKWAVGDGGLGVPPRCWHIGGGSAGGNLAASVALQARDGAAPLPASSVLVYPVLHEEVPAPSEELAAKLSRAPAERRFSHERSQELNLGYVGRPELLRHPYAFPAYGTVEGLPPTLIVNAEIDDLRPSGEAYAAQLAAGGVGVAVVLEPGALHGHLNEPESPQARRTVRRIRAWLSGEGAVLGGPREEAAEEESPEEAAHMCGS
ncbi:alpha/beta hydrolase [Nocardiopsis sp. RSe5-2]|uniref:Alpha/beta hydrolase n=1 Tax=Nocardiopsis endophytica TaxID=3018445 RepID=A0ABT4TY68_9ACTN|nr:alpha/beta hydrolase [Nocardiopsis endophytica]MDA2809361.1 alpha/beta hydrolase [Nocardiopsis endophytica]